MDSSSATTLPPPWLPVLADHRHQLLHDFTPASASSPSPSPRDLPLRAARRVAKRRPRPSRRLPTTYVSADAASFRRMVHQLTGADELMPPLPQQPADAELLLSRPAPVRPTGGGAVMNTLLPTLDTSAFLVAALSRTGTDTPGCDISAGSASGAYCNSTGGGGFPT